MSRRHKMIVSGLLAMMTILSASSAFAYEQTKTCTGSGIYACEVDETPLGVRWPRRTITYRVNERGSADINGSSPISEELRQAVRQSFDPWNQATCSDLTMIEGQLTDEEEIGFSCDLGEENNLNLVVWREDWPYASNMIYALTSVTFNPKTGIIYDADIEFNDETFRFTLGDNLLTTRVDVRNTLTHEVGHFLGLDHSPIESATMYGQAPLGELSKRDLHPDDRDGVCAIYPVGQNADESYALEPICKETEDSGCLGCTQAVRPAASPTHLALLTLLSLGIALYRRKLKAQPQPQRLD